VAVALPAELRLVAAHPRVAELRLVAALRAAVVVAAAALLPSR